MKISRPLGLALILATSMARAEWSEVQRFEDGMRVYANPASARRSGTLAELMHLVRWAEPQRDEGLPPYLSTRVRSAYDCARKHEKYLGSVSYAGTMGNGDVVVADEEAADIWYSISENSLEETLWTIACAAK